MRATIITSLAFICAVKSVSSQKIHEEMLPEERVETFQTIDGSVPDYEVVPIHWPKNQKRSSQRGSSVYLKAFGRNVQLWLNPTDGILASEDTPVWSAKMNNGRPQFGQYSKAVGHIVSTLYEDLNQASTLAVSEGVRGRRSITGTIGSSHLAIRPIPERLVHNVTKSRRSVDDIPESEFDDHHYHIVYKTPELPENAKHLAAPFKRSLRLKRSLIPGTVYPEILVIVDNNLYNLFRKNMWKIIPYLLAFWNGVDMKYRSLENPKYRLNIAGIILAEDENVLEYVRKNKWDTKTIVVNPMLQDFGKWLFQQDDYISVDSYDVAVTMTPDELCTKTQDGDCQAGTLGLAWVKGTCTIDKYWKDMTKTMIVQDTAGYDGIHTAAHELGHSLGANHDGTHNLACAYHNGHIMAGTPVLTEHSSDWSDCTLEDFQTFLDSNPKCIYNKPALGSKSLPRYLPGKIMDANEQCQKLNGADAWGIDETICQRLKCGVPGNPNQWTQMGSAAAEGTPCGPGKICLHGKCILERQIKYL